MRKVPNKKRGMTLVQGKYTRQAKHKAKKENKENNTPLACISKRSTKSKNERLLLSTTPLNHQIKHLGTTHSWSGLPILLLWKLFRFSPHDLMINYKNFTHTASHMKKPTLDGTNSCKSLCKESKVAIYV